LDLLNQAGILHLCHHSSCQGLTPEHFLTSNEEAFINKGIVAEQFIAQHLVDSEQGLGPPEVFYWMREKKNANAKADFVISLKTILPIEVKSGANGKFKSLWQFCLEKNNREALVFDMKVKTPDEKIDEVVEINLPSAQLGESEKKLFKIHLRRLHVGMVETLFKLPY